MKHHAPALTIIPEDEELTEDLKVIRPLNEVKNDNINYHQIIKNHVKKEYIKPKPKPVVEKPAKIQEPIAEYIAAVDKNNQISAKVSDQDI